MKKVDIRYAPLYRCEIFCYIVIWASGVVYASYSLLDISTSKYLTMHFYPFSKLYFVVLYLHVFWSGLNNSDIPDLVPGWSWLGRNKDFCHEWSIWTKFIIYSLSPWIILHSSVLLIIQNYFTKVFFKRIIIY